MNNDNPYGFTLLELLVSITIMLVIVTIVYSSFNSTHSIVDRVEGEMEAVQSAQRLFTRLRNDLVTIRWTGGSSGPYVFTAGTNDADTEFNVDPVSVDDASEILYKDTISFTALADSGIRGFTNPGSDLKLLSYTPLAADNTGLFSILYVSSALVGPKRVRSFKLVDRVKSFHIRYCAFDTCDGENRKWAESWDVRAHLLKIPRVIEFGVTLVDKQGRAQSFKDTIKLIK